MSLKEMTDAEIARLASVKLQSAEAKLARLDDIYSDLVRRIDEIAGDDRLGAAAGQALEMRAIQEAIGGHARGIKGQHALLSKLECDVLKVPMTRGGER